MRAGIAVLLLMSTAASAAERRERIKVAVLDVRPVDASSNVAARIASDVLRRELAEQKRLNVISSASSSAIIGADRHKQLVACVESGATACLAAFSEALGARYFVTARIERVAGQRTFELRLLDAESSDPALLKKASFSDEQVEDEVRGIAQAIIAAIPEPKPIVEPVAAVTPTPVAEKTQESSSGSALAVSLVAGGLLAAGGGTYLVTDALDWNQRKREMFSDAAQTTRARAQQQLMLGYGIGGVGLAAAVVGVVLLATSSSGDAAAVIVPQKDGAAVAAAVRF